MSFKHCRLLLPGLVFMMMVMGCDRTSERADAEPVSSPEASASEATAPETAAAETTGKDERAPSSTDQETAQAEDLQATYKKMAQMYEQMADRYAGTDSPTSGNAGFMREMHGQMMFLHDKADGWGELVESDKSNMHDQMPHRGMHMGWRAGMDRWHERMAEFHENANEMTQMHDQMARMHRQAAKQFADAGVQSTAEEAAGAEVDGATVYAEACALCHGAEGQGAPGVFPPLAGAEAVTGDKRRLVRLVQHGLVGPVEVQGKVYDGVMPSFRARLSTGELAAVLTYIRQAWSNDATPVSTVEVQQVAESYKTRPGPWRPEDIGLGVEQDKD